jgi:hypothetical protein
MTHDGAGNFADRKADAARLFDAADPLFARAEVIHTARTYADENGLPYPPTLIQGIEDMRATLARAGLPQAEIDTLPGLTPLGDEATEPRAGDDPR